MLGVLTLVLMGGAQFVAARRDITARDLVDVTRIGGSNVTPLLRISPDGRSIVAQLRRTLLDQNAYVFDLVLGETRTGTPLVRIASAAPTASARSSLRAEWSPDSQRIAYLWNGAEADELRIVAVATLGRGGAPPRVLAVPGPVGSFTWSPTGDRIAMTIINPSSHAPTTTGVEVDVDWPRPRESRALWTIELTTGRAIRHAPLDRNVHDIAWSPDGRSVVFSASQSDRWDSFMKQDLFVVEIESNAIRALVVMPGRDAEPSWSPDGKWIAFVSSFGREDWTYAQTVAVIPSSGGEVTYPAHDFVDLVGGVPRNVMWSADSRTLYFTSTFRLQQQLFAAPRAGGPITPIAPIDERSYSQFSLSTQAQRLAFVVEGVTESPEIGISPVSTFGPLVITDLNVALRQINHAGVERLNWKSRDGKFDIHGVLVTPPRFQRDRRYPLIVLVESGPSPVTMQFDLQDQYPVQVFAARGFLVLAPNTRGRGGYGNRFYRAIQTEKSYGSAPLQDVLDGVDHVIRMGIADPERLGIAGFSYGGYLTAFAITRTNRFKGASIGDSHVSSIPYALLTTAADPSAARLHLDKWGVGSPHEPRELKATLRQSPVENVRDARTPALLEYGADSEAVTHGQMLFQGFRTHNVPAEFVVYPRTGHGVHEPLLRMDSMRRNLEWVEFWVANRSVPRLERKWRLSGAVAHTRDRPTPRQPG